MTNQVPTITFSVQHITQSDGDEGEKAEQSKQDKSTVEDMDNSDMDMVGEIQKENQGEEIMIQ